MLARHRITIYMVFTVAFNRRRKFTIFICMSGFSFILNLPFIFDVVLPANYLVIDGSVLGISFGNPFSVNLFWVLH